MGWAVWVGPGRGCGLKRSTPSLIGRLPKGCGASGCILFIMPLHPSHARCGDRGVIFSGFGPHCDKGEGQYAGGRGGGRFAGGWKGAPMTGLLWRGSLMTIHGSAIGQQSGPNEESI